MNAQPQQRDFTRYALPLLGLFFILIVAPLFFTVALRDVFTLPKTIPLSIGTALLWIALTWSGKASFKRSLTPAILAMSAATILSALLSVDMPLSILGPHQQQFYALVPMALCVLAYYAAANVDGMPPTVFVLLALLGGVAVCLPALIQWGWSGFMAWTIQDGRAGSTFGSAVFLGSYLAVLLPLAWVQREKGWANTFARVATVLIILGLLATRSRGSIAAAAAGVFLVEMLHGKRIALLAGIGIFLPVSIAVMFMLRKHAHGSDVGHFEIWRIAIMSWKAHPIFGWGPDTFSLGFRQFMTPRFVEANGNNDTFIQLSAHSDFLQVLSTLGIVGFAAYSFLIVESIVLLRRALNVDAEAAGIAGAMLALFVNAKFNPIPLAVLVISAALMGSVDRAVPDDREDGSRFKSGAGAAAALLLIAIFSVMCVAERHQRRGEDLRQMGRMVEAAEEFNQAAQINPFDLWYTQRQLDYFWSVIPHMPGVDRMMLATFSHNISENIGRLHPADPTAHELRAISYKFEGDMLGHDRYWECDHELEVAERLAPHFSTYSKRRADLAALRKKSPGA